MNWLTLGGLMAQYVLPVVEKIYNNVTANPTATVTQAQWDELKALASQTARTQLLAALARANIPITDPTAVALLAQVPA